MHALLLTVFTLTGADGLEVYAPGIAAHQTACSAHDACGYRHHDKDCFCRPMPQTCYDPSYGCYPGTRFNHRYPAFHGTYYRRPYNYRNVFDYPWHAEPHEPTSLYSYDTIVGRATGGEVIVPTKPIPADR